ncbi:tail fiber domain-containing protein, partial [Candidatus Kaiserbacteria bacterium]|nr:tail fiber domain-containing protein [Candidatus Kaiserbacteria bacterium]
STRITAGTGLSWTGNTLNAEVQSSDLANYLPLTGGTLSGNLAFSGTAANIALGSNYLSGDGGDEGISVDSSGNVSVTHSLTVSNNGYATVSLNGFSNTDFVGPLSKFDRARGTIGAPAVVQDGDILMELNAQGYSPSGSYEPGAEIVAQVDGTPSGTAVPGQLIFWTRAQGSSPARRMVIRADGKVGIGTTTPSHRLTVDGDMLSTGVLYVNDDTSYTGNESMLITNEGGYTTLAINAHSATSFAGSGITFRRGRGTIASPSVVQDGDLLMQLHPVGRGNTAWSGAADLTVSVDGAVSGNIIPSRFSFFTTPVGGTQAEVMRITSDGYVGIGTTSPTTILTVAGVVTPDADNVYSLGNSSYRWSEVYAANGTINTSDRRLKDNITDIGYGLNEVLLFDPVRFTWKDHPEQGERFGLIAQDVQQIIPEVVNVGDDPNHTLGIRYTELVAVLINAMQQMWDEITGNKEKIAELENRIEALEAATQTNTSSEQNAPRPATIVTVSSSTEPAVPDEAGEETASSTLSVDEPVISDTPEEQTTSSTPDLIPTPEPTIIATTTDES